MMDRKNPKYILRNHILEHAISAAEQGDFSGVQNLLKVIQTPFDDIKDISNSATSSCRENLDEGPSIEEMGLKVTWSS